MYAFGVCVSVVGDAHTSMQMTRLRTFDLSTPLRECSHMYEWGRANALHDKSVHRGLHVRYLKRAKAYSLMPSVVASNHQETGTTLKTDARDR